jgi:hypothetical protein
MRYQLSAIPPGEAGTDATVREMARLVNADLERPGLRLLASRILRSHAVPSKSHLSEAKALYSSVVQSIRYQKDPIGIETVQSPEVTLEVGAGDCDDMSALYAGLAMAVGLPVRFRAVAWTPGEYVHIWPEVFVDNQWWPADTTEPRHGFGWRPPEFPHERVYNLNGEVENMSLGQNLPVSVNQFKRLIYDKVQDVMARNWKAGQIDARDVGGYLKVIRSGDFPTRNPLIVAPAEQAVVDFLDYIETNKIGSLKPAGRTTGLEGLGGFLSSVWDGIKDVGGSILTGGSSGSPSAPVVIQPTLNVPAGAVQAQVGPGAATAAVSGMEKWLLPIGIGLAALLVVPRLLR